MLRLVVDTAKHIHISTIIFAIKKLSPVCLNILTSKRCGEESLLHRKILLYRKILSSSCLNILTIFTFISKLFYFPRKPSLMTKKSSKQNKSFHAVRHGKLNIGESKLDYIPLWFSKCLLCIHVQFTMMNGGFCFWKTYPYIWVILYGSSYMWYIH